MDQKDIFIEAKLSPPALTSGIVERQRLLSLLNAKSRLTLIIAGAGYGKTTLLAQFVRSLKQPFVWYSLDERDNDISVFISYIVHGISQKFKGFGEKTLKACNFPDKIKTYSIENAFILEVTEKICEDFTLVIDDYHLVLKNREINEFLSNITKWSPKNIHLVISSREIPLISLSKLRREKELVDIKMENMAFTKEEAEKLFEEEDVDMDTIMETTEGWITALTLFSQRMNKSELIKGLLETAESVYDYLFSEIYANLSQEVRKFLIQSSVFTILIPSVLNEALLMDNSLDILRSLEQKNLFTFKQKGGVFRYHYLMKEFLEKRLKEEGIEKNTLCIRGAEAYEKRELFMDAAELYIEANSYKKANNILKKIAEDIYNKSQFNTLLSLIERIPQDERDPWLTYWIARIYEVEGRWDDALIYFENAEKKLKGIKGWTRARWGKAIIHFRRGKYKEASSLLKEILSKVPLTYKDEIADTCYFLSGCYQTLGELDKAISYAEKSLSIYRETGDKIGESKVLHHLALNIHWAKGQFEEGIRLAKSSLLLARESEDKQQASRALYTLARIYETKGEHDMAVDTLQEGLEIAREISYPGIECYHLILLADIQRILGKHKTSLALCKEALKLALSLKEPAMLVESYISYSQYFIDTEKEKKALRFAQLALDTAESLKEEFHKGLSLANLGYVYLMGEKLANAEKVLDKANILFKRWDARYELSVVKLYSALCAKRNGSKEFLKHLSRCISIAKSNGYDFLFLKNERKISIELLEDAITNDIEEEYVGYILSEFGRDIVEPILCVVKNQKEKVKRKLVEILADIGDRRALRVLSTLKGRYVEDAINKIERQPILPLKIYSLSRFKVYVGDRPVSWKSSKAKSIFKYLLLQRNRSAPKEVITELLWPEQPPGRGDANFRKALSLARHSLEPEEAVSHYLTSEGELISLDPKDGYYYDAEEFDRILLQAKTDKTAGREDDALTMRLQALNLYRGDLLPEDIYEDYSTIERERLRENYLEILLKVSEFFLEKGEYNIATQYANQAVAKDRLCEDGYRLLILLEYKKGNRTEAIRVYKKYRDYLKDELGVGPDIEITELYEKITRHR
ncbi:MAG: tetratricopeptide repeat protein [bacterium]|nr:tetratricopeptide repeat protein [bacterium]